jgi:hypothetical protein
MPSYLGQPQESQTYDGHNVACLNPGGRIYLFGVRTNPAQPIGDGNVSFEVPVADLASIEVALVQPFMSILANVGLELIFNANPGAFNIQVQEADTPADGCYITPSPSAFTITASTNEGANWVARVDLGTIGSKFVRLLVVTWPNAAVGLTAKLTLQ